jgi:hypothetical protein
VARTFLELFSQEFREPPRNFEKTIVLSGNWGFCGLGFDQQFQKVNHLKINKCYIFVYNSKPVEINPGEAR